MPNAEVYILQDSIKEWFFAHSACFMCLFRLLPLDITWRIKVIDALLKAMMKRMGRQQQKDMTSSIIVEQCRSHHENLLTMDPIAGDIFFMLSIYHISISVYYIVH